MVLASEPRLACGVDVAAPDQLCFLPEQPVLERMRSLLDCFSPEEARSCSPYQQCTLADARVVCVPTALQCSGCLLEAPVVRCCTRVVAALCSFVPVLEHANLV